MLLCLLAALGFRVRRVAFIPRSQASVANASNHSFLWDSFASDVVVGAQHFPVVGSVN